jgi:hypothetical protein
MSPGKSTAKPHRLIQFNDISDEATVNVRDGIGDELYAGPLVEGGYRPGQHRKVAYGVREFVGWDGEGITYEVGTAQSYVLFGNSKGDKIIAPSLSTVECLALLLESGRKYPYAIHVGFALNYDVNMICKDLNDRELRRLKNDNHAWHRGYRIHWYPGKWFSVSIPSQKLSLTLYDVFGFFQASFISACEKFLGKNDPLIEQIREGKRARGTFTYDLLEGFVLPYWERELQLLVRLMESLRKDLVSAKLSITRWHGPGAVASKVFSTYGIKHVKDDDIPRAVNIAAQYAYAGGRFEQFRCGHYAGQVHEYDINSAYPYAIAQLPNLRKGHWEYTETFQPQSFGVWHLEFDATDRLRHLYVEPQPLYCRSRHGLISYPNRVNGWYWTPEAALVSGDAILGGYVFIEDTEERPFAYIQEMYQQRKQWKTEGNSAERALKLALNSQYGKMAQRIGGTREKPPTWHQLEWAGYVTSTTRAMLFGAVSQKPESIIAVETDAVFSTEPLNLNVGTELGQWEETLFDSITYIQSGFYFAEQGGDVICKYRGLDKDPETGEPRGLPYRKVLDYLRIMGRFGGDIPPLAGTTTRFVGLGLGLATSAIWRSWETSRRMVDFGGSGKRTHVRQACPECQQGLSFFGNLHHTGLAAFETDSQRHSLPWEGRDNDFADMEEIEKWQPQVS